jgi:DNA-binding NarL/FixJ family response regulator
VNDDNSFVMATANIATLGNWREAVGNARVHLCHRKAKLEERLAEQQPGQYFLDLSLPELGGVEGVRELIKAYPQSQCLAFSPLPSNDEGLHLLKAGVKAYCNRLINPALLSHIITLVDSGEVWVGATLMEELIRRLPKAPMPGDGQVLAELTPRELDIAGRIGQGESNKSIATALGISERTVKSHLTAIFKKTGSKDRLQLALMIKGSQ